MEIDFNKYARFQRTVDRYRTYVPPPKRTINLEVHLLVGRPGTGKTESCYDMFPNLYAFPIGKDLWSDGYMGQPVVLVDDFSGNMPLKDVLRFLDRYPIQIPKKHGFNWWLPEKILITTNIHPNRWYVWTDRPEFEAALRRRIHFVWDFNNKVPSEDAGPYGTAVEIKMEEYWPL